MEAYVPAIQEKFRRNGFPRFRKLHTQEVLFGPSGPTFKANEHWEFQNADKTWAIAISPIAVTLQTSRYGVFEDFEERLRMAVETVCEIAEPQFADRLGLRYVNLIGREAGKRFRDYLHPGFLGLPADTMGVTDLLTTFVSRGRTSLGTLMVKCIFVNDGSTLPPDLQAVDLDIHPNLPNPGDSVRAFLDFDHVSEGARAIDVPALIDDFGRLHENAELAFDAATTKHAKSVWGEKQHAERSVGGGDGHRLE